MRRKGEKASISFRRLGEYLNDDVREDLLLESELLLLSFATGIQDAAAWPDYSCFASNQTGNTLFLAIGAAGLAGSSYYSFPNIGISLGSFLAGGLVMGQIGNAVGARKRSWLLASNAFQTLMVFAASFIQYAVTTRRDGPWSLAVIFLLAFSAGAQVAMGRSLRIVEITTAMATAAYIDVVADPKLVARRNRARNRRVMFLVMLTAGCFAGAFIQRAVNSKLALLLSAIGKAVVTFAFFFNKPVRGDEEEAMV